MLDTTRTSIFWALLVSPLIAETITPIRAPCPESNETQPSWVILSENVKGPVTLTCATPEAYPFCDRSKVKKFYWRLPISLLEITLAQGEEKFGWRVSPDGFNLIQTNQTEVPQGVQLTGIYQCLALAETPDNATFMNWYHLQWAFNVFASERMLINGPFFQRYGRNLLIGIVALGALLAAMALLIILTRCSYSVRMKRRSEEEDAAHERTMADPIQVDSRYSSIRGDLHTSFMVESA